MSMNHPKTKQQIAQELGISLRTLQRWIKKSDINVPRGLVSPEKQQELLNNFGYSINQEETLNQNDIKWRETS